MRLTYNKKDGNKVSVKIREVDVGKPATIGRGTEAVIRVEDEKCSRVHASIMYWDGMFILRDMKSFNGTYLNGERIEVTRLKAGDVIKIGDTEIKTMDDNVSKKDTVLTSPPEEA